MEITRLTLEHIVHLVDTRPEQVVFDTKQDFTPPRTDDARAEFIKDVVAIANGTAFTHCNGFVIYGVEPRRPDPVIGVTSTYDDASLQQLVRGFVDPMIEFLFYDDVGAGDGRRLAVLHVEASREPFHVITRDIGGLRDGTSFIREGSSTRGVRRSDWIRLCFGPESPYLGHVLRQYGAAAQLMNAETARIQTLRAEQKELERQMARAAGLPGLFG